MDGTRRASSSLRDRPGFRWLVVGLAIPVAVVLLFVAIQVNRDMHSASATNLTGQTIRLDGACSDDVATLAPGQSTDHLARGHACRVDDGDGADGLLGCITLTQAHTTITLASLRPIKNPDSDDCL